MEPVADRLRDESPRRVLQMTPDTTLELAGRLGDEDARLYAAVRNAPLALLAEPAPWRRGLPAIPDRMAWAGARAARTVDWDTQQPTSIAN